MNDLLLDTHAMLWFFWDDPQLSPSAKAAIATMPARTTSGSVGQASTTAGKSGSRWVAVWGRSESDCVGRWRDSF